MLDLFITHWNEPWDVGKEGFQMLSMQRIVDWSQVNVTLVHDGSEAFPEEYFSGYPFEVKQVCLPHGGIAAARNWCIKHATEKWIKWCDFDDAFANLFSLFDIMNVLSTDKFDMLWFDLLYQDKHLLRIQTERNPVFIHDKIFRREFLTDRHILFNEELTWCEDSAFLAIIEMEIDTQRIGKIRSKFPIYLYKVRQGSLCNRPEIKFANLQSFFKRHTYVADEFLKHGMVEQYNAMCVRVMGDSYYTLVLATDIAEDRSEHEKEVWDWYDKHKDAFHSCKPEHFKIVMRAVNNERGDCGEITTEAFLNWINKHERGE